MKTKRKKLALKKISLVLLGTREKQAMKGGDTAGTRPVFSCLISC